MSTTLITGAAGFTGRYLARRLAEQGHRLCGLFREPPQDRIEGMAESHVCDLADGPGLRAVLDAVQPDHVVHLAAIAFVAHGDIGEMYRTNVIGTRTLLGALEMMDRKPRSVLVASSANIYGNGRDGMLDESMPPAPANDYGVTKVAGELISGLATARLPIIVTRPFNYTGVGQSKSFLIPKIVDHVRQRAPEIELGNLDVARDFSDVRMVVDTYARLLETPAAIGGTFNVCSGRATSLHAVLDAVRRISGHDFAVRVNPAFVRADEVKSLCGNAARIESVIGPLRHVPLDDTLTWMLTA
ncbi:GDP-mannose 4,6 dehydratase [Sphingobium lactosutens]|uniref:NAD-dependent epimerase/dehydratase family protein n=1 Tax=Sphingobium lactosutens TaxID=522773 RepID=UPI0015BED049|nr:NAD-dependent epimerase/dehydratase family protein [Sphingobium lactosutens]NWK95293.1 GDP-mannose 4,6 dehydratase [Sphingobium lactosutens]